MKPKLVKTKKRKFPNGRSLPPLTFNIAGKPMRKPEPHGVLEGVEAQEKIEQERQEARKKFGDDTWVNGVRQPRKIT